jgi:hypothetical protein
MAMAGWGIMVFACERIIHFNLNLDLSTRMVGGSGLDCAKGDIKVQVQLELAFLSSFAL